LVEWIFAFETQRIVSRSKISEIAEEGLRYFAALYEFEREARELKLDAAGRQQQRQQRSKPALRRRQ
jgi:hypothetical protein